MKKILFILSFFVLSLWGQEFEVKGDELKSEDKTSIYSLVQRYVELNRHIEEEKKIDANASVKEFRDEKREILTEIPSTIVHQTHDKEAVEKFLNHKKELQKLQARNTRNHFSYANATLDLLYMDMVQTFYSSLFELQKLFTNVADSQSMIDLINKTLNELQDLSKTNLEVYKNQITNPSELEKITDKEELIMATLSSYDEILQYLKANAHLLESNYIFSVLKLKILVDKINNLVDIDFINSGKVLISLVVLVFFLSLRRLFSHILYFVLVKLVYRNKNTENVKEIFVESIKKPIGYLLLVYALSLCLTIAFYPEPVPIKITNILYIVYAVFISWLAIRILDGYGVVFISKLAQKSGKREVINLIIKILYFVILIIAILFILARLGFNISAIIASLGIGGLAVALAAKDIIANFFASILLLFDDSFNQGDWVEIAGVEGTVVETGLRKTTIRTFDNSLVFLPNSAIMAANIKNWSKRRMGRHVKMLLGVGYDASPEKIEACVNDLREFLEASPLVAHEDDSALKYGDSKVKYKQNLVSIDELEGYKNACYVALSEFGDSSINIELYFYTKAINAKDFRAARQSLMLEFMRIVERNGLSFAFPSRSIYIENFPDTSKLPNIKD